MTRRKIVGWGSRKQNFPTGGRPEMEKGVIDLFLEGFGNEVKCFLEVFGEFKTMEIHLLIDKAKSLFTRHKKYIAANRTAALIESSRYEKYLRE